MIFNFRDNAFLSGIYGALCPHRKRLIFGLVSASIAAGFEVAGPILLKMGIDNLRQGQPLYYLYIFSGAILLAAAITGIFRFFMRFHVISVSRHVESDVRDTFFAHLMRLAPAFFDVNRTGDIMARATDDIERVRMVAGPMLQHSVNTILLIFFSGIMMFTLDYVLALGVLTLAPIVGGAVFMVARYLHIANIRQQEAYSDLNSHVQENLTGIRVIKAFAREDYEMERFEKVSRKYFKRSMKVAKAQALFHPLLGAMIGLGIAGIMYVGGRRVASDQMTLGDFIAFMSYLNLMTWPMIALGWLTHLYQRGSASHKRIMEILSAKPQFADRSEKAGLPDLVSDEFERLAAERDSFGGKSDFTAPQIIYKDISLRYRENESEVLSGLNIAIPAGSTTAIVGKVGSGKSSFVRMIPRLYDSLKGEIIIDGKSWRKYNITELRKMIGYVDQSPFLFSSTIRENIALGNPDAAFEEIIDAAKTAYFDEEITDFSDGYDTMIGERGVTLSGGQQQRLTLSRALLIDPPILILDDALSAVDADTESEILLNLKDRLKGRTTLFVTHRLNAAENADKIIVFDKGRLAEEGTHSELLEKKGLYATMFQHQRLREELRDLV